MGNRFYSLKRMQAYSSWAEVNFRDFAVLIGDWIYAFTHSHVHGQSYATSLRIATAMGDAATAMCEKVSSRRVRPLTVLRWQNLRAMPKYGQLLRDVVSEFTINPEFRSAVRNQVCVNLGSKVDRTVTSTVTRTDTLHPLAKYLLHEIAGLITVSEFTRFHTEVYPGKDLSIVQRIYSGCYPRLLVHLPCPRRREFVEIVME